MKTHIFKVTAIIFDMDGVITNTMPYHYKAWKQVLMKSKIPITHFDIYSREGQRGEQALKEIFHDNNIPYDKNSISKLLKEKEDLLEKIVKTRFITGARSLLKDLKKRGFLLGLVTGTSRRELHKILSKKMHDIFNVIITADDIKKGKPAPDPYKKAIKELKLKPNEGIVIENAPLGISAAKNAKLKCIAIETSLSRQYLLDADLIFSTIKELKESVILKLKMS